MGDWSDGYYYPCCNASRLSGHSALCVNSPNHEAHNAGFEPIKIDYHRFYSCHTCSAVVVSWKTHRNTCPTPPKEEEDDDE